MTRNKKGSPGVSTRSAARSPSSNETSTELSSLSENGSISQQFLLEQISSLKEDMYNKIEQQKQEIIDHLTNENILLKAELVELRENLNKKENLIVEMEKDIVDLQQYVRRNNIEFSGIPEDVDDNSLQEKVIKIAESIDVHLKPSDIEACHRLRKGKNEKTARTIVRFVNRKNCEKLHMNKNKIKSVKGRLLELGINNNLYVNCNLCPYNKFLWGKCKRLFSEKLIDRFWVYNGCLYIFSDTDINKRGTKISHLSDLQKLFPGYNFS